MNFDFTLENFMQKVSGKPIEIEATNTEREISIKFNTVITNAKLEYINSCNRYELTINDNIKLLFEEWDICEAEECQNILTLSRKGEQFIFINLPLGDSWVNTNYNANIKINKCKSCIFNPLDGCNIYSQQINECEKFVRAW